MVLENAGEIDLIIKFKVKFALEQATKAQEGSRGTDLLFL
jgi:hypothetical protein